MDTNTIVSAIVGFLGLSAVMLIVILISRYKAYLTRQNFNKIRETIKDREES